MFRGCVQYSILKLPSEWGECHLIEAVENTRMYSRSLHVWQKMDNGPLSWTFSQMLFYPLCFLLLHLGMLQWTTHQQFMKLVPLRSRWFHCWEKK